MPYPAPISIATALDRIQKREYVLPAIQREFVWNTWQIEQLFDSLLREYPISTFLFWHVEPANVPDFQWYEFLSEYHGLRSRHNKKTAPTPGLPVTAVLDGQQRLTSLYLGLKGSYASRKHYGRHGSADAYPVRRLYLELLHELPEEDERKYSFRFLTDQDAKENGKFWFKVADILPMDNLGLVVTYLMNNGLLDTGRYSSVQSKRALDTLSSLFRAVHEKSLISYYEERGGELEKVLQIFIRINSGGTKLSYSDLLLSIATAQWSQRDAREEIHHFVDELNDIGAKFNFDKDFVLKSCLVLADLNVKFKVDNFGRANMQLIEQRWESIRSALRSSVELLNDFGYNRDTLTSTNAVIPIAYFILKNGFAATIRTGGERAADRTAIRQWLARVLLKGTFGGTPDNLYPTLRNIINANIGAFPLQAIIDKYRGERKSITFSADDVESVLELNYGSPLTLSALSLIYQNALNTTFRYHQDHLHPKSVFSKAKLDRSGISDAAVVKEFQERFNSLPNLQLLEGGANVQKQATALADWLNGASFTSDAERTAYAKAHFYPADQSLALADFKDFFEARKERIRQKLTAELGVV